MIPCALWDCVSLDTEIRSIPVQNPADPSGPQLKQSRYLCDDHWHLINGKRIADEAAGRPEPQ